MELYFLGTGAGSPSKQRNVTSIALNLGDANGAIWLFDAGEGTQHQFLRSSLKLGKISKLFVTHLHGDHIFGIPGLLSSRSYQGGDTPLTVYGPPGIERFVRTAMEISATRTEYAIRVVEYGEGPLFEEKGYRVAVKKVEHRIDSYGFRIEEPDAAGRLDSAKLERLGIPSGPLYGELKRGGSAALPDGTVVRGRDVVGPDRPGRKVAIIGDTRFCRTAVDIAQGVDVLVHEATFAGNRRQLAAEYGHATAEQAAQIAREAGAGALVMTHISSRYQDASELLAEARAVFPNSHVARDLWSFPVPPRD